MKTQRGIALIEALTGLVIFSVAVLGIVALQAKLMRQDTENVERVKASLLAIEILNAATADFNNLPCYTVPVASQTGCSNPTGTTFTTNWVTEVQATLPGATALPPTITLNNKTLTLTLFWKMPMDASAHRYTTSTQVGT